MSEPAIGAAFIGAVALLFAAILALIPYLGVLHRLERVVNILEKIDAPEDREPLLALRDRLIDRLRPKETIIGMRFVVSIASSTLAALSIALGVWVRTEGPVELERMGGPLVVGGIALLLVGLAMLIWALVHARQERGPRRVVPKTPAKPTADRPRKR